MFAAGAAMWKRSTHGNSAFTDRTPRPDAATEQGRSRRVDEGESMSFKDAVRGVRARMRASRRVHGPSTDELPPLRRRIRALEKRITELEKDLGDRVALVEDGLEEQRALSQRIAVLADFVAEVVSASARGDRTELDAALSRYSDGL
jgi:hypothetical protein